jgi:hypothetical protein
MLKFEEYKTYVVNISKNKKIPINIMGIFVVPPGIVRLGGQGHKLS